MQLSRILCPLLFATALTVAGQVPPATTPSASAKPPEAPAKTMSITMAEAIQTALQHNLDVQIQRFGPMIAEFNLKGSYSVYEPALTFTAVHSFTSQPGGIDQFGRDIGSREIEADALRGGVNPGVSGISPTGLKYSLSTDATHSTSSFVGQQNDTYSGSWNLRLQQPLLRDFWIDGGRFQILVNRKNLKVSELLLMQQIILTINNVEQAYYNLIFSRENVKVQETALQLAERSLDETKKKVQVGALAQLEEKQAESLVATSKADLLAAQRNLALQENVLKSLLTSDYNTWQEIQLVPTENLIAVPMIYNLQESWKHGLTLRPDLQQLKVDLERRDITVRYQKNQLFPQLDLIGSYGHNGLDTSFGGVFGDYGRTDNPSFSYGITLSIPLGNQSARNRYKASKAEKQQALLQLKKQEQDIMIQIDDAIKQAQTNFERVEATRQARLFAEAALDAEQKKLENGKSTPFFVLQFQRNLTAAKFEEIRALAEYNNALAQLSFREGMTLERHKITVTVK